MIIVKLLSTSNIVLKKGEVKQNLWKILEAKGKFSLLKHIGQNRWERQEEYSLIIVDNGILKEWVKKIPSEGE